MKYLSKFGGMFLIVMMAIFTGAVSVNYHKIDGVYASASTVEEVLSPLTITNDSKYPWTVTTIEGVDYVKSNIEGKFT